MHSGELDLKEKSLDRAVSLKKPLSPSAKVHEPAILEQVRSCIWSLSEETCPRKWPSEADRGEHTSPTREEHTGQREQLEKALKLETVWKVELFLC